MGATITGSLVLSSPTVIFQGKIDGGHGIEELLASMPRQIAGRELELDLAGLIQPSFEARVRETVSPLVDEETRAWLDKATRGI